MKGIYAIWGEVTNKDLELIGKARRVFPYVTIAILLPTWREESYADHRKCVSAIRTMNVSSRGLEMRQEKDGPVFQVGTGDGYSGLAVDFFEEGELGSFLNKSNATSWIVQRSIPSEIVLGIDFPKYFIN